MAPRGACPPARICLPAPSRSRYQGDYPSLTGSLAWVQADPGFFGPDSITWEVNREMTVLFGGARSLLLNAAHPLVAAGARRTGGYRRDPWQRLIRTVRLQSTITFGTRSEARAAADQINRLHATINGIDPVTGQRYDALDPELLLWVHAGLVDSSLLFFEKSVRPLTPEERQRYHEEAMVIADLVMLPRHAIPATFRGLRAYIADMTQSADLRRTEVADEVARLIVGGAVPAHIKPIWTFISFAAVGTLPGPVRDLYDLRWGPLRGRLLEVSFAALRTLRPFLPDRYRLILPARWGERRMQGEPSLRFSEMRP